MMFSYLTVILAVIFKFGNMGWLTWTLLLASPLVGVLVFLHLRVHSRFLMVNPSAPLRRRVLIITSNLALIGASLICPDVGDHDAYLFFNLIRDVPDSLFGVAYTLLGMVLVCDIALYLIYEKQVYENRQAPP